MTYKHTFNRDHNYLVHFNPNHDPKNGRFTFKTTSDAAKKDVDDTIASRKEAYDKAMDLGRKVSEEADNLGKEYARFFNNISPTDKEKDEILTGMEHDCGISKDSTSESRLQRIKDNCDDPELYELLLMDHIGNYIDKKMSENKELQNKRDSFDKLQSDYWNSVRDVIGDLENKYKNAEFKNPIFKSKPYKDGADDQTYTSSELFINNYIYGKKMDTSWNSYIYRHFDDYWVNDLDENYDAFDRIEKELGEVKHSGMNDNYLEHFNKNHSKANGQFVSGDGDGDGEIGDGRRKGQYSAKIENYHKGTLFKDPYYIDKNGNKRSYDTYKDMPYDAKDSEKARAKVKKYGGMALKVVAAAAVVAGAAYVSSEIKSNIEWNHLKDPYYDYRTKSYEY